MNKKTLYSIGLSAILSSFLIGCGSSGSGSISTDNTTGTVADGYVQGAKVYIDINNNGKIDSGDKFVGVTNLNGAFTLPKEDVSKAWIVVGGSDVTNGQTITTLKKPSGITTPIVTPITTITANLMETNTSLTINQAKTKVAQTLGINEADITANPVTNISTMKAVQTLNAITQTADTNYTNIAKAMSTDTNLTNVISTVVDNNSTLINKVNNTITIIKNTNTTNPEILQQITTITSKIADKNETLATDINTTQLATKLENFTWVKEPANTNFLLNTISNNLVMNDGNISDINITSISTQLNTYKESIAYYKNKDEYQKFITNKYDSLSGTDHVATVDDAKNLLTNLRTGAYEFYDRNNSDTQTVSNVISTDYQSKISPALNNIDNNLSNSISSVNTAITNFDSNVTADFNTTISAINQRIKDISIEKKWDENTSFTTNEDDNVSYTYTNGTDYVTQKITINGQSIISKFKIKNNDIANAGDNFISSNGNIALTSSNYDLNLSKIYYQNGNAIIEATGKIIGENNSTITSKNEIKFFITPENLDKPTGPTIVDYNNINLTLNGQIKLENGEFDGNFTINNVSTILSGNLNYDNIKINGKITINIPTNDLQDVLFTENNPVNDYEYNDFTIHNPGIVTIDGDLLSKIVLKKYSSTDTNDTTNNNFTYDLTTLSGKTATCKIEQFITKDSFTQKVDCGNANIKTYNPYNNVISANINGNMEQLSWYGSSYEPDDNTTIMSYDFENENFIDSDSNTTISDVEANPHYKSILNLSGNIKFSGTIEDKTNQNSITADFISTKNNNNISYILQNISVQNGQNNFSIDKISLNKNISSPIYAHTTFESFTTTYNPNEYKEGNTSLSNLNISNINGTIYDNTNTPIILKNLNIMSTAILEQNTNELNFDNSISNISGSINYNGIILSGYTYMDNINNTTGGYLDLFLNVQRDGYEPFSLSMVIDGINDYIYGLITMKNGYQMAVEANDKHQYKLADSNGVILSGSTDNEGKISITNKNNEKLGTYNPATKEVEFSDNTTETIY